MASIKAVGADDVARRLTSRAERLADLRPLLNVVAAEIETLIDDSFKSQASPSGQPWQALSGVTVFRRIARKRGRDGTTYQSRRVIRRGALTARAAKQMAPGGMKALIDTGRLRRSIFAKASGRSAVVFGAAKLPYARAQTWGNPANRMFGGAPAPIPARPFLPVNADGSKMFGGASGRFWAALPGRVRNYVVTGAL